MSALPLRAPATPTVPARAAAPAALGAAVVASIALCALIAAAAHGLGAPDGFTPLTFGAFAPAIVLGLVLATIAWATIRARATDPRRVLSRLVPSVVVLSLVPDIAVGVSGSQAHTTWGGVAALMVMHLVVAAVGVASLASFLPVRRAAD